MSISASLTGTAGAREDVGLLVGAELLREDDGLVVARDDEEPVARDDDEEPVARDEDEEFVARDEDEAGHRVAVTVIVTPPALLVGRGDDELPVLAPRPRAGRVASAMLAPSSRAWIHAGSAGPSWERPDPRSGTARKSRGTKALVVNSMLGKVAEGIRECVSVCWAVGQVREDR